MNPFIKLINFPQFPSPAKLSLGLAVLAVAATSTPLVAKEFPLNHEKAPKTADDLLSIQKTLMESSVRARKATVSIKLGQGFGSGVLISPDGLILTAAHVSGGVKKKLTVIMNDGTEYEAISMGLISNTDAAMMRITKKAADERGEEFPYVEVNKNNDYKLGHWVFALGHAGGFDKTRGPVLRLGRIVKDSETTLNTDCKVIGGDSGGPLFDMEGNLIGIHSRVSATMEENMHVPMREYIKHWDKMEADEFVGDGPFAKRPVKGSGFLGIGTTDSEDGVLIGKVMEKTPGAKAGLKTGDIILELDGVKMTKKAQFSAAVKEKSEGDELILLISRKGKKQTIKVTLGKR